MYCFFVDGSGQTGMGHRQGGRLYVLSGVAVHEKDWRRVDCDIARIKTELFPELDPESWELHAYDIWNDMKFFSKQNRNLNFAKKQEIFSSVLDLACKSDVTLFNVIIRKDQMRHSYPHSAPLESSWQLLIERLEHFLGLHPENVGLVFMDSSQRKAESRISNIVYNSVVHVKAQRQTKGVIERPVFVQSDQQHMIQLVDMVGYVIHKHYKGDPAFETWFERLKPSMYAPTGRISGWGLKEFP